MKSRYNLSDAIQNPYKYCIQFKPSPSETVCKRHMLNFPGLFSRFISLWLMLLLAFSGTSAAGSRSFYFKVVPVWGENRLEFNKAMNSSGGKTVIIENFRFYISGICFMMDEKEVFCESESFRLIDASNHPENIFEVSLPEQVDFNTVKFNIGIDSITNYAGARGGNLDPVKGMYWSWQSGYINLKLEGKIAIAEKEPEQFEYHLGGFMFPFNSLQTVNASVKNKNGCTVLMDLKKFADETGFEVLKIMSPSAEAMHYSKIISNSISVK